MTMPTEDAGRKEQEGLLGPFRSNWTTKEGRELRLLVPAELDAQPKGTVLWSIHDERVVIGEGEAPDRETRFGHTAYGLEVTPPPIRRTPREGRG